MRRGMLLLIGLSMGFASSSHAQAVGSCETGTHQATLRTPFVEASLFTTGGLFFSGSTTSGDGYLVPRAGGVSTIFAASLWLGGTVEGDLRVAAARYGNYNFWPGPLVDATSPPADCAEHDRIFVVSREDVQRYYDTGELTDDLRAWPHMLGAPVRDGDGIEGNYNLEGGDQPDLIGDAAAWWVMNDAGNAHPGSYPTAPLGVEVRVQAFGYGVGGIARSPALLAATVYRYEIVNRGTLPIEDMYLAMFADADLGDREDDYMGTDTLRNMAYVYNATDEDALYGVAPPAQGVQFLQGPVGLANGRDDDGDGAVDEPEERLGVTTTGVSIPPGPHSLWTARGAYNQMRGFWEDGTPIQALGQGYQTGGAVTSYIYPGDPGTESFWSEVNLDGNGTDARPGDRRLVISTGPFRLEPGASEVVLVGMPYARGTSHLQSITELRRVARTLQVASSNGAFDPVATVPAGEKRLPPSARSQPVLTLSRMQPNPSRQPEAALTLPAETRVRAEVYDALGRQLEVLVDGVLPAGETALAMPDGLPPGTYLLRVQVAPGGEETLTFTVVR